MTIGASASGFQRRLNTRALLFDRLAGRQTAVMGGSSDPAPPHLNEEAALHASVARELADLFNTRAPVPPAAPQLPTRSTIDYGFPDLSAFSFGEHKSMDQLTRHVRDTILCYEPRLHKPSVHLERARSGGSIIAIVTGTLEAGGGEKTSAMFRLTYETGVTDPDAT